jgi:serine O-acetyltransferase
MKIVNLPANQLAAYVRAQINHFFPTGDDPQLVFIDIYCDIALKRLDTCVSQVKLWTPGQFDILHSSQYCTFLYYLSNTIWRAEQGRSVCTKLFLLNKALNGIDCFYEIELPEVFFIGHSVGIVLAKATYGNHLVLYQNSTVGKNHGVAPVLEDGVILYPNTAVIGSCQIRRRSVISQGVSVINQATIANSLVFQSISGGITCKASKKDVLADFFRDV